MSPASPGGSPRSAGGSDPGSFQITASALSPGVCEILCVPFESGVSISHSPLPLLKVSPTDLQSQMWGLLSQCKTQAWRAGCGPWTPCSLRRTYSIVVVLPPVVCLPGDMGFYYTMSPPLVPIFLWFLLYFFSCRRSFLLFFQFFSSVFPL